MGGRRGFCTSPGDGSLLTEPFKAVLENTSRCWSELGSASSCVGLPASEALKESPSCPIPPAVSSAGVSSTRFPPSCTSSSVDSP
eukprot:2949844-Rhodomonas_salina.1